MSRKQNAKYIISLDLLEYSEDCSVAEIHGCIVAWNYSMKPSQPERNNLSFKLASANLLKFTREAL